MSVVEVFERQSRRLRVTLALVFVLAAMLGGSSVGYWLGTNQVRDEARARSDDNRAALIETCRDDNERWGRFQAWIETIQLGILDPAVRQQLLDAVGPVDCVPRELE